MARIHDDGQREIWFETGGASRALRARVGDVSKALLAVASMVDSGHKVIFDSESSGGSMAIHKTTGSVTKFVRRNNVFEVDLDIVPYSLTPNGVGQVLP